MMDSMHPRTEHDGQMLVEEYFEGTIYPRDYVQSIRYGLGARGIDRIERVRTQSGLLIGYPLYDAHGNMVATLAKSGSNDYALGDGRSYDAWGGVRTGNTTGEPNPRNCANLGHVADDESGFVYMRARYYEPGAGRFISEDPARDGGNWLAYCANDPVDHNDRSGRFNDLSEWTVMSCGALFALGLGMMAVALLRVARSVNPNEIFRCAKMAALGLALTAIGAGGFGALANKQSGELAIMALVTGAWLSSVFTGIYFSSIMSIMGGAAIGGKTLASTAVIGLSLYSLTCLAYIASIDFEGDQ